MNYHIEQRKLHFKRPAGTSRGIYHTRDVWYIHLSEGKWRGVGECAPLPDLSCDALSHDKYEERLHEACRTLCQTGHLDPTLLQNYPSILFGLESALNLQTPLNTRLRNGIAPKTESLNTSLPICRINGLIWMGSYEEMHARIEEKLQAGFRCIKLKIGAINFEDEMSLIRRIRAEYPHEAVELRVDANGAFLPGSDVETKLAELARYDIHSIEQPIRQGQWEEMAHLCAHSPLPIALDEELIGVNDKEQKVRLLNTIRPQYLVLKPSLHGGFSGCDEWIQLAKKRGIDWWATSALESNIGLTAIARWIAQYHPTLPQGLGTGMLFTDNTPAYTEIRGDELYYLGI